jgi:NADH-quinone oxidoreductase subunit L
MTNPMDHLFPVQYSFLIPLLPLAGAAIAGFFGARWLKQQSHWPIWLGVGAAAVLSIWLLVGTIGVTKNSGHHETAAAGEHAAAAHPAESHAPAGGKLSNEFPLGPNRPAYTKFFFDWINAGDLDARDNPDAYSTSNLLRVSVGFLFDPLTAMMLAIVCGIGFFITVFAAGYMKGEEGYFRFFAYLGLFIFMMALLVMGENLVMLYLGWEGVGLCSYLLIGYYYDKPAAREAAKKAFLVNRVGDFGFGLGIMLTFLIFGTVSYFGTGAENGFLLKCTDPAFINSLPAWKQQAIGWIPFLLMLGAFGKSAQFPLYVWLPDAMEGPTPVSALIHAATMVTAGVYMIVRTSILFVQYPAAMWTVAAVGTFTAIFAATIALRQFDLKKVFAYSTVSQLGFMFAGVGLLAPVAGAFHLMTHAFFKALLFLSSGVVMHAMAGELDMRKMSGLRRLLPQTRLLMLIGCLALAGMVPLSGFWSKDEIVGAAFGRHSLGGNVIGAVLLLTAFMTAYYTFRLYFRVFEGPEIIPPPPAGGHGHGHDTADAHAHASESAVRTGTAEESGVDEHLTQQAPAHGHGDHGHHNHEPAVMMVPLYVLAIGAILAGFLNTPWGHYLGEFLGASPSFSGGFAAADQSRQYAHLDALAFGQHVPGAAPHETPWFLMGLSAAISALGIFVAYVFHLKERYRAEELASRFGGVTRLLEGKYWVDEAYQNVIVEPLRGLGRAFFWIDRWIVDGVVWLFGVVPWVSGAALRLIVQRGYLQGYAAAMLFGIAVILLVIFL